MGRNTVKSWLPWIGVTLVAAMSVHALVGQPPYGDDIRLHVYRIPLIDALWQAGRPYARWIPYLNFGYGSPLFLFYPPLSAYLLTAAYWLVGQNAPISFNLLLAVTTLVGAVGMFLLGRRLYGTAGGLLATLAYSWSPQLLYHVFARASTANALALAFFPLATLAFVRIADRPSTRRIIVAAAFLTLTLLSHTTASFLFIGPLAVLAVIAALSHPHRSRAQLRQRLLGVIVAQSQGATEGSEASTKGTLFGQAIRLNQADLPATVVSGRPFELTLSWESVASVNQDYTVFIHLLSEDGNLVTGQDGQPLEGDYPTSYWEPGEVIVDHHVLSAPASPGIYRLEIGLYQLATGERLITSGPNSQLGDRILLATVEIISEEK